MDCANALDSLSAYLDDALDPLTKADVERHLSSCDRCRSELNALRACVQAVSSLERIPAPPGFLHRVHECIEHPSPWKRLLRTLLLPWHIKVPLHVAGAVAMVLLILATVPFKRFEQKPEKAFETQLPQAREEQAVHDQASQQMAEEGPLVQHAPLSGGKVDKSASSPEAMPIQLVLVIPGEKPVHGREFLPEGRDKGSSALQDTEESLKFQAAPPSPERSLPTLRLAPQTVGGVTAGAQSNEQSATAGQVVLPRPDDRAGNGRGERQRSQAASKKDQTLPSPGGPTPAVEVGEIKVRTASSLEQRIRDVGGIIHRIDYANGKDRPFSVLASIPAVSYPVFLDQLRVLGELRDQPFEGPPSRENRPLLVNITLIPAE